MWFGTYAKLNEKKYKKNNYVSQVMGNWKTWCLIDYLIVNCLDVTQNHICGNLDWK